MLIVINKSINIMKVKKSYEILKVILKDITNKHTVTTISKEKKISRVRSWKLLKELQKEDLIKLSPVGNVKTSVQEVILNWNNPLLDKILALLLTEDALKQKKWRNNFKDLEHQINFLILFGSILHSPNEANDIDILNFVSNEENFVKIDKTITNIQISLNKKIHAINITEKEFMHELNEKNRAYVEALKKGIVLFGQENFIKFIKGISK